MLCFFFRVIPHLRYFNSVLQVKISSESCLVIIPDEIYREACVYTTEEAIASCQVVGYPAMIKASWGGGGKGIRKVCFTHGCIVISDNHLLVEYCILTFPVRHSYSSMVRKQG